MDIIKAIEFSENGKYLPVCEYFHSIQGEGHYFGKAMFFLRLSGCNIACHWCDTKHSWNVKQTDFMKLDEIAEIISASNSSCVVITGGEPTLYNLDGLIDKIHQMGITVNIESSGTGFISEKIDWVTLSPKENKKPLDENFAKANELKIVIGSGSEKQFKIAEQYSKKVNKECKLYLQVEWGNKDCISEIVEYIKLNSKWRLSLQSHKYIGIE